MLGAGAGDCEFKRVNFFTPPLSGGLDLDGRNSGCARLGGEVGPPLGVVVEEVAVLVVLVRRHRHAVRAAVRRAVGGDYNFALPKRTVLLLPKRTVLPSM